MVEKPEVYLMDSLYKVKGSRKAPQNNQCLSSSQGCS